MPTETNLSELKINVLTKEQYNSATKDANQVYMITDEEDTIGSKNVWYGTCTTAASTAEKNSHDRYRKFYANSWKCCKWNISDIV